MRGPTNVKKPHEAPIFIIGVHRSGTTLLRYMLNSHPRIFVPPESDFIPRFFLKAPTKPLTPERVAVLLDLIFTRYRFVREWQGNPPEPAKIWAEMPDATPAAFLDALYSRYAAQRDATRWGDKTPIYSSYVPLIHRIFPRAQFVHIHRDGRDVAVSMLEKWGKTKPHIDIYFTARNWVRRTQEARRDGRSLPAGLYHEIRYEALVQDPERVLQPLCAFLNEDYVPAMSHPHHLGQTDIEPGSFHDAVRSPPGPERIGRWRSAMTSADRQIFEGVAGELLHELEYPIVEPAQSPYAHVRIRRAVLTAKYLLLQSGRRVLQAAGLFPPI